MLIEETGTLRTAARASVAALAALALAYLLGFMVLTFHSPIGLTGAALLGAGLELTRGWPLRSRIASTLVLIAFAGVLLLLAIHPHAITG